MDSKQASPPRTNDPASESDLENRAKSLSKLLRRLDVDGCASDSPQPHALGPVNELKVKIESTYNMLRVAKLLSEPARQSLLSKVRESLEDFERVIATNFDVEMTSRHQT
jgi:hypothetical protein